MLSKYSTVFESVARLFDITGRIGTERLRNLRKQSENGPAIDAANMREDANRAFSKIINHQGNHGKTGF